MEVVYVLYLIACFVSLFLYKENKIAIKIGFGLAFIASLYGVFYFLGNLEIVHEIILPKGFLFNPHFVLNPLGNFFSFVICLVASAASVYSIRYAEEYAKNGSLGIMSFFFNLFVLSMLLVISSANVFWFMVFWELMTIVSYFLICFNDSKDSLRATVIYMGIAHIGGVMILLAFLLLAHQSGSMEFSSFAHTSLSPMMAGVIFLFAFIGFGSKAGMFPFHVWLPKAHPAAPSNVSALMSGVMIKVAVFGIIKFCLWLPIAPWYGILILVIGAISALLGVLYALTQHDYKALLAYHSVENIGIILLGLGTGIYGIAIHSLPLATIGFLAGLYHILNHATFKGLLFLGAGSVLYTTHTKNMEILGGLAKKMPLTAFAFLIGAMAITAMPPLNGFVSEWITYQAMLQAALGEGVLFRLAFTASVVALALTGALAVMCFVKVYTVIFGGVARDKKIYNDAREVPLAMLMGMYILVIGCFVFGLGSVEVAKDILKVISSFTGVCDISLSSHIISTPFIAIILISFFAIPFVFIISFINNTAKTRETDPWVCGFKYNKRMQMTASPFTGSLRKIMDWLFKSNSKVVDQGYFKPVKYENHAKDIWWNVFYEPFIKIVVSISNKIQCLQNGNASLYVLYILCALFVFIGIGYIL